MVENAKPMQAVVACRRMKTKTMAYTVKQVAAMSGTSVRMLQQILFYRELGFELKRIKEILTRPKFGKVAALKSHRQLLEKNAARTRTLIEDEE
jgi:DNA-binding transcriptional MerR regulator